MLRRWQWEWVLGLYGATVEQSGSVIGLNQNGFDDSQE